MKKKLTNAAADLTLVALTEIAKSGADVPVRAGFRILQNIRALEAVVGIYRSENDRIIRDASGGRERLDKAQDPEAFERCQKKLKELAGVEIEVEIAEIEAQDLEDVKLPMKSMFALQFITTEKEENDG